MVASIQKLGQHALRDARLQGDDSQFSVKTNDTLRGGKVNDHAAVARGLCCAGTPILPVLTG